MPDEDKSTKQKLKPLESAGVGAVTGLVAATAYMPFWTLKMRYQCGMPFTLHPLVLYKGFTTILAVMMPITAIQIFNTARVEGVTTGTTVSPTQRMVSSFAGGASSALISNLLNLLVTQQHKHKYSSPLKAGQSLVNQHGMRNIFIGLPTTAVGEGLYTLAYFALVPLIKPYTKEYCGNEFTASIAAGVLAGVPTAIITQPLDRIKTLQHQRADEKDAKGKKYGLVRCISDLYKSEGLRRGLFKGLLPRGVGLTVTITAAGATAEMAEKTYRKYSSPTM